MMDEGKRSGNPAATGVAAIGILACFFGFPPFPSRRQVQLILQLISVLVHLESELRLSQHVPPAAILCSTYLPHSSTCIVR